MKNFKKYLPSQKFISIILIILVIIALFFAVKGIIGLIKKSNSNSRGQKGVVVGEIIQKDSNKNGIADWEEYLWGLDPYKNGKENKDFIDNKKKELSSNGNIFENNDPDGVSQSESLSRQFFALIVSLQQSGNLDEESIKSISDTIGGEIDSTPIPDTYTESSIKGTKTTAESLEKYENDVGNIMIEYMDRDMGEELIFIAQGIQNSDPSALYAARTVASSYREIAKKLSEIEVPNSKISSHTKLINDYDKTGQALDGVTMLLADPIIGMKALINYKDYNNALIKDIESL